MDVILEPSLLFISQREWENPSKRDEFLKLLLDHLGNIETCSVLKILWNDRFEVLLWKHPQSPPWRKDRDWNLQIVPTVYRYISKLQVDVSYPEETLESTVTPTLSITHGRTDFYGEFLKAMSHFILGQMPVTLGVGLENKLRRPAVYEFSLGCESLRPRLVNEPDDWFEIIDIVSAFWPKDVDDVKNFRTAVLFTLKTKFPDHETTAHPFIVTTKFMEDIVAETIHQSNILSKIAKRLTLSQAAASLDGSLQDEEIATNNERRIRVTLSNRIHYCYAECGSIKFLRYYPEGHHDDGLR